MAAEATSPGPGERGPGSVGRGAGALFAGRIARAIAGWIGTVVIARELSTSEWGAYSFIFGLLGIVGLVVDLQVGRVVLRQVIDAGPRAGRIVGSYVMLRAAIGIAAYVAAVVIVVAGGYPSEVVVGTLVAGLVFFVVSPAYGLALWFDARLWLAPTAVSLLLGAVVQLGLVLAVALSGHTSLVWFAATAVAGEAVVFAWRVRCLFTYRLRVRLNVDAREWWGWLKEALPLAIGYGLVTLYYKIDIVMLGELDTLEAVGRYSVGYKFADLVSFVPQALLTPVLTLMVAAWPHDRPGLRAHFRQSIVLLTVGAIGIAAGFALVAGEVIEVLYGARYAGSADAARLLVTGAGLQGLSYLCFVTLVSVGRTRPYALAGLAGVAINVALNFALIPSHSFNGSATATVITECLVLAFLLVALSRTRGVVTIPVAVIARTLVAAVVMAGVYLLCDRFAPWPVAAIAAAAAFLVALHMVRVDGKQGLGDLIRNARFDTSGMSRD